MRAAVITCSNRSARGERPDDSGELLATLLADGGHEVVLRRVVPDDVSAIRGAIHDALLAGARAVLTTGGTGLTPTDLTPEVTRPLLDREVPGIAEAIRAYGVGKGVGTAALSRGLAGVAGDCLVVNLPGSRGGVKDAIAVLEPLLVHAVEQISGGDH